MEADVEDLFLDPVASTIPKWRAFKFLRWTPYLHNSALVNNALRQLRIANVTMETNIRGSL
jgi:hypothetical protein